MQNLNLNFFLKNLCKIKRNKNKKYAYRNIQKFNVINSF